MRWYSADREAHGGYWFHWTTADEIAWKQNYQKWMSFVNDYKNAGGRVAVGDDAGFIYKLFGFAWVREASSCCRRRGSIHWRWYAQRLCPAPRCWGWQTRSDRVSGGGANMPTW